MTTASLTYPEIARRFGVTTASARNLVRRKGWPKALGNDGLARIMVPLDEIPDEPPMRSEGNTVQPLAPDEGSTVQPSDEASLVAISALGRHIERLEGEVAGLKDAVSTLTTERDAAREQATALQVSLAALEATRDALRDERDRLLTREQLRESRSWWPWRRSA
jgi:hypothetical protein